MDYLKNALLHVFGNVDTFSILIFLLVFVGYVCLGCIFNIDIVVTIFFSTVVAMLFYSNFQGDISDLVFCILMCVTFFGSFIIQKVIKKKEKRNL
ncbi:hypothetical protein MMJ62_13175 [Enterococcus cecorum]|uniref:hypothetical protein n=1 Tax=Enterococcus cecorum TaxID=44008 RepID=UPI001FACEF7F|nr:hypothetical protein [Enterococcus cecorum]MCJ0551991.1 hypothetical protein [Enterococcus cecorum]